MSARQQLADLIRQNAPETWEVFGHPAKGAELTNFQFAAKPVAIVVEQRSIQAGQFSDDGVTVGVGVILGVWVVVDGARGGTPADVEDTLEIAVEEMVKLLAPFPDHVWDGVAERNSYDEQKPAYLFTITAAGDLT